MPSKIHHQLCGHEGKRMVAGHAVDGFCLETNTVFQFHGCYWHGCPKCYPSPAQRQENVIFEKVGKTKTRDYKANGVRANVENKSRNS